VSDRQKTNPRRGRPPIEEITERQRETLEVIHALAVRQGIPPTVKEVADELGITSASAHQQMAALIRKGYLRRTLRKARAIEILRMPVPEVESLVPVPIVGSVAAGQPILAAENIVGEVMVDRRAVGSGRCFALRIQGDSMIGAGIGNGDLVIVRQQPVAENGEIVVALLGDEATCKRLAIGRDTVELRPENPRLEPIIIDPDEDVRILGKVVAIRREQH
jgi:repressor LexA